MDETSIKVPSELFALAESSRYEGVVEIPVLEAGPDDYVFSEPLSWYVDVTNTGSALLVSGNVRGMGVCGCARCLDDVSHEFDASIEGYFLIDEHGAHGDELDDDEMGEDEFDVLPEDHVIDLVPLIKAALIVDAPDFPLCKEDCKGLCPQCGANLNEGPCGCEEPIDPLNPFAALASLKFED